MRGKLCLKKSKYSIEIDAIYFDRFEDGFNQCDRDNTF